MTISFGIVVQAQRALAALHAIFLATTADVQACFLYHFYMAFVNSRADHFFLGQFSEALALPMSNQYSSLQMCVEERVCWREGVGFGASGGLVIEVKGDVWLLFECEIFG